MAPLNPIKLIVVCIVCGCLLLLCCTHNVVDGGTETGNAVGILYNPNGSRAANAKVYIVSVDHNPKPGPRVRSIDSTTTDDTGAFFLDSMPEGYYNVLGAGDSGVSYNDSVFIQGDTTTEDLSDTLRDAGTLRGVVALQPGDDSRTVFILVFGTQTWTTPADPIGNFTLASMAEGTYHIRILTTLDDYDVLDTNLYIIAGTIDTLSDTIYLPFTGIPIPTGLTLSYDTLKQIVTLTWNACDTNLVQGYNVYRKHSDSDFVKINIAVITDTTYSNSSAIQDETYEYKIKAVNKNDEEGEFSEGVQVEVVSVLNIVDSIVAGNGNVDGQFGGLVRGVLDDGKNYFIIDTKNKWLQKLDTAANFLFKIDTFNYPRGIAIDSAKGYVYISDSENKTITKIDTAGNLINSWSTSYTTATADEPGGIIFYGGKLYVALFGGGIIVFDSQDNLIDSIDYQFNNDNSDAMDFAINPNGDLYVVDAANVLLVDTTLKILSSVYQINDHNSNQDPNIEFLTEDTLLLVTRGADSPFNSTFYLIDNLTGNLLSFWQTTYPVVHIIDIREQDSTIIATTSTGRILFIKSAI